MSCLLITLGLLKVTKTKYLPFATIFKTLYGHAEQVIQLRNRKEQLRYYKLQEELFCRLIQAYCSFVSARGATKGPLGCSSTPCLRKVCPVMRPYPRKFSLGGYLRWYYYFLFLYFYIIRNALNTSIAM